MGCFVVLSPHHKVELTILCHIIIYWKIQYILYKGIDSYGLDEKKIGFRCNLTVSIKTNRKRNEKRIAYFFVKY